MSEISIEPDRCTWHDHGDRCIRAVHDDREHEAWTSGGHHVTWTGPGGPQHDRAWADATTVLSKMLGGIGVIWDPTYGRLLLDVDAVRTWWDDRQTYLGIPGMISHEEAKARYTEGRLHSTGCPCRGCWAFLP